MKNHRLLEISAVVSSLTYTVLYTYGFVICWVFAILGSAIYLYLCYKKRIYAEALLQLFYVITGIYGWIHWYQSGGTIARSLSLSTHTIIIASGFLMLFGMGFYLQKKTDAATPYVDSFTTVFGILATFLMIDLIPENWAYWIAIDLVSIYLYWNRKLYLTAGLYFVYTLLSINGLVTWMNLLR